jgi:hypothetical protein
LNGTYATTGSNTFKNPQTINSNLIVTGSITAQMLVVQTVSSSVIYSSGSNVFGNSQANTQVMTGSVNITGSVAIASAATYALDVTGTGRFTGTITSTITNALVLSNNTSTTQYVYCSMANSVGNARYGVDNSSGGGLGTGTSANSAVFGNAGNADVDITTNNISRLKIASTGAATFSSTVDATQGNFTSAPSIGGYQVKSVSNSSGNTSYGGVLVINSTGKGGYLTCGDNSSTTWYGGQAGYVTLAGTAGAGMKFRVDADDDKGMMIFPTTGNITMGTIYDLGYELNLYSSDLANTKGTLSMRNGANNAGGYYIAFVNNAGGLAGYVSQTSATTILYSSTSDYRLKENVLPMQNAISRILKIKPVTYKWKNAENEYGEGFIAHELQEIVPLAVAGQKDDMNKDGTIKTQGVDYGMLTPLLVAAMQEQQALIKSLQAQITELKNK